MDNQKAISALEVAIFAIDHLFEDELNGHYVGIAKAVEGGNELQVVELKRRLGILRTNHQQLRETLAEIRGQYGPGSGVLYSKDQMVSERGV